ncbi:MAG: hypothetical protein L3J79_07430 [Candidatus Marinimicrobia bacterium]|nr:hypothetical protein [Candidatus Neomarinimicrobiota bacterium]
MQLNDIGKLAAEYWSEIPDHFPFVYLEKFVVMPNHIHGIIVIHKQYYDGVVNDNNGSGKTRFQNQGPNSISSIVGSYKWVVTKNAREIELQFGWQS